MRRILALVEGPTERAVLDRLISPYLGEKGFSFQPKVIGKPGHKGGMRSFEGVESELLALLRQERRAIVTTFFDLYALNSNWPGYTPPNTAQSVQRATAIEKKIWEEIRNQLDSSDNPTRFLPYLQVHEVEALLFSDPQKFAECIGNAALAPTFAKIVADCGGCEQINDSPQTAPSKRIESHFPGYKKGKGQRAHAPIVVERIGLDPIRAACPRFGAWLQALENISTA